ncbi:hypothetical protein EWM64_g5400 [Hericium alpestre]|uniref:Kinesin motor domain-containing protein n=1 Tax=Hericium alpestre TaxID=135208 RepID=A0A4Y9ZX67_9AGAM|nr:hypothetical protein EWM64_g5400 [Hericium alpestre]
MPPEFHFDEILTGSENKPVYNAVARNHVYAAMDGYNSVIFAYGQTASGKTFTLSGDEDQPGIIPRAMKDIFTYIKRSPSREYLLRCSYLEIYNEAIHDLLAPPSSSVSQPVQIQGSGANVWLSPLREEVVTSLKSVHEPSLSGDARISVIATINPDANAVAESLSTLHFAQRIKKVQLNAKKKEVVDTDALLERYRQEIEELKKRLAEKEAEAPVKSRRLSAREQLDESKAMQDLNSRIKQLSNLILTSQTVDRNKGDESRPSSPAKIDFDMSPYQLREELLSAQRKIETQETQILSLEAALHSRPELPPDAPESEKDKLIADQGKTIRELEIVVHGYEENLGEPLRAVREDVEQEWIAKVEAERRGREAKDAWAAELVRELDKEKKVKSPHHPPPNPWDAVFGMLMLTAALVHVCRCACS